MKSRKERWVESLAKIVRKEEGIGNISERQLDIVWDAIIELIKKRVGRDSLRGVKIPGFGRIGKRLYEEHYANNPREPRGEKIFVPANVVLSFSFHESIKRAARREK